MWLEKDPDTLIKTFEERFYELITTTSEMANETDKAIFDYLRIHLTNLGIRVKAEEKYPDGFFLVSPEGLSVVYNPSFSTPARSARLIHSLGHFHHKHALADPTHVWGVVREPYRFTGLSPHEYAERERSANQWGLDMIERVVDRADGKINPYIWLSIEETIVPILRTPIELSARS